MIAVGLSKQQVLDADPKSNQQINFTANQDRAGHENRDKRFYFILEQVKRNCLNFYKEP